MFKYTKIISDKTSDVYLDKKKEDFSRTLFQEDKNQNGYYNFVSPKAINHYTAIVTLEN